MKLGTIPNHRCVKTYLRKLKPVVKAANRASGRHGKHRCWQKNTSPKVGAIETDGLEKVTEVFEKLDRAEVANQVGETIDAGIEGNRRTVSSGEGYQSPEFKRVRRNLQCEKERDKARKAVCPPAKESCKESQTVQKKRIR